ACGVGRGFGVGLKSSAACAAHREPCSKAGVRLKQENRPETDVGASFARDAPRGRRSILQLLESSSQATGTWGIPFGHGEKRGGWRVV
ncbi:hypothetical protein, partial [Pseudomonas taiwanensis]|uniref:hypothetical protein n=1 Tax=Pseudomonas taiwanensis TaxID=470150 RepID=UPI001EE1D94D